MVRVRARRVFASDNGAMPKALIVASDGDWSRAAATVLRTQGWDTTVAPDAITCLGLARREEPDVAVVAGALPGGSGASVIERLRALIATAVTPVIGLARDQAEGNRLVDAGAQEYLEQPVSPEDLLGALKRHAGSTPTYATAPERAIKNVERLDALHGSGLLDTLPDEDIDRFTRLASTLLGTPTALVSLVDADRQFFKSAVGLSEKLEATRQTPLTHSYCQWAVSSREPFLIPDAREHRIVKTNPAIDEYDAISYCGVPIFVDDQAIGTLCVIDSKPRRWTDEQMTGLQDLAGILSNYLAARKSP